MKYKTIRERDIVQASIVLVVGILSLIIILIDFFRGRGLDDFARIMFPMFLVILLVFVRSFVPIIRRRIFVEKGKRYSGKIISADMLIGKQTVYYLLIEFSVGGKRLIRRTEAYYENPNRILQSGNCSIYEYKGKYLEDDFQTHRKLNYNDVSLIALNMVCTGRKNRKYV